MYLKWQEFKRITFLSLFDVNTNLAPTPLLARTTEIASGVGTGVLDEDPWMGATSPDDSEIGDGGPVELGLRQMSIKTLFIDNHAAYFNFLVGDSSVD